MSDAPAGKLRSFQLVANPPVDPREVAPVQKRLFATVSPGHDIEDPGKADPVRVHGTLHVGIVRGTDGHISSVYRMDVDSLERPS